MKIMHLAPVPYAPALWPLTSQAVCQSCTTVHTPGLILRDAINQLSPLSSRSSGSIHHPAHPPDAQIRDGPRFPWRGMLLDVGRHFFDVPFILKMLDTMALYKLNRFHWHLTEDQVRCCWRPLTISHCCDVALTLQLLDARAMYQLTCSH